MANWKQMIEEEAVDDDTEEFRNFAKLFNIEI